MKVELTAEIDKFNRKGKQPKPGKIGNRWFESDKGLAIPEDRDSEVGKEQGK